MGHLRTRTKPTGTVDQRSIVLLQEIHIGLPEGSIQHRSFMVTEIFAIVKKTSEKYKCIIKDSLFKIYALNNKKCWRCSIQTARCLIKTSIFINYFDLSVQILKPPLNYYIVINDTRINVSG